MAGGDGVGSQTDLILVDTNVFVIDLRYKRDANYPTNQTFLEAAARNGIGFTTIVNLLELCGILSFNLNEQQLFDLWHYFPERYNVTVLPATEMQSDFPACAILSIFEKIKMKAALGDALLLTIAEKFLPFVKTLVTWDKDHFVDKFSGKVLTPGEYLDDESAKGV
jgi:predicted nucleic acid-binding protein